VVHTNAGAQTRMVSTPSQVLMATKLSILEVTHHTLWNILCLMVPGRQTLTSTRLDSMIGLHEKLYAVKSKQFSTHIEMPLTTFLSRTSTNVNLITFTKMLLLT